MAVSHYSLLYREVVRRQYGSARRGAEVAAAMAPYLAAAEPGLLVRLEADPVAAERAEVRLPRCAR
ncbi:hypothetical protein [Nocardia amikacinitolerans]|uniref:hypothetical protein n=1 Tax=Nocardia amikacinitolerans TaxID=756689 RepID=UPI0012ED7AEE|nr:hypothetical protein [Nocardia amikacinitolerans]